MKQKVAADSLNGPKIRAQLRKRMGVGRTARYHILRILRLKATPHSVAAGVGVGVAAAFMPVVGVHIAMAVGLAWLIGGNMIAATAGTLLAGNPFTYPFIWAGDWEAGRLLQGQGLQHASGVDLHAIFANFDFAVFWEPVLKPMLIGSVPFSVLCGGLAYVAALQGLKIFRARREARLLERP